MNHLTGFLGPAYLWVKAAHLTFVIFWLAGLVPASALLRSITRRRRSGSPEDRAWIERETRVRLNHPYSGDAGGVDTWVDARIRQ